MVNAEIEAKIVKGQDEIDRLRRSRNLGLTIMLACVLFMAVTVVATTMFVRENRREARLAGYEQGVKDAIGREGNLCVDLFRLMKKEGYL